MKSRLWIISLLFFLLLGNKFSYSQDYVVYQQQKIPIQKMEGVTFYSLKALKEVLNLKIKYYPVTQLLSISYGGNVYKFVIGKKTFFINGGIATIDYSPRLINDEIYLPGPFVSRYLLNGNLEVSSRGASSQISGETTKKETSQNELLGDLNFQEENNIAETSVQTNEAMVPRIILDAGHGGNDSGTVWNDIEEKKLTLKMAKLLKSALEIAGYKVFLTRKNDVLLPLEERTYFANSHEGDLFISLHMNAAYSNIAHGTEIFVPAINEKDMGKVSLTNTGGKLQKINASLENLQKDIVYTESIKFSKIFASQFSVLTDETLFFRGIKKAKFKIFENILMPSVLIEMGFLTNSDDRDYFLDADKRQQFIKIIVDAVNRYYEKN